MKRTDGKEKKKAPPVLVGGEAYCNECDRWHVPGQHNRPAKEAK